MDTEPHGKWHVAPCGYKKNLLKKIAKLTGSELPSSVTVTLASNLYQ